MILLGNLSLSLFRFRNDILLLLPFLFLSRKGRKEGRKREKRFSSGISETKHTEQSKLSWTLLWAFEGIEFVSFTERSVKSHKNKWSWSAWTHLNAYEAWETCELRKVDEEKNISIIRCLFFSLGRTFILSRGDVILRIYSYSLCLSSFGFFFLFAPNEKTQERGSGQNTGEGEEKIVLSSSRMSKEERVRSSSETKRQKEWQSAITEKEAGRGSIRRMHTLDCCLYLSVLEQAE